MVNDEGSAVRKAAERDLHDHLRGSGANEPVLNRNKKFYAVSHLNSEYVQSLLRPIVPDADVLDYCSGNGQYTFWLAEQGARAHGIDISPVSVENARNAASRMRFRGSASFSVMDAENLEFDDDSFDVIVVNGVLHHLDLDRAYKELARVLRPTGQVIATEALRHNPLFHLYRKRTPDLRSAWETDHILGRVEIKAASEFFDEVGVLRFFHLSSLGAVPFRGTRLFDGVLRSLAAADVALFRIPGVGWQAWMAVFRLASPKR